MKIKEIKYSGPRPCYSKMFLLLKLLQDVDQFEDCCMFIFFYIGHGGRTSMNEQVLLGTEKSLRFAVKMEWVLKRLMDIEVLLFIF